MTTRSSTLERAGFWFIVGSLAVVQIKIAPAQILFGLAATCWLVLVIRERSQPGLPPCAWPLGLYAAMTLVSSAFSIHPLDSFIDDKQLVLFLIVPVVMRLARGERAMRMLDVILAVGATGALVGIVEATMITPVNLEHRPTGLLSHYMTFAGVLMLSACAAVARLLFYPNRRIWPGVAVPALLAALALTLTMNAWIGTAAAITVLVGFWRPKMMLILPVAAAVALMIAPQPVRDRVMMFSPRNDSNRDRLQMLAMGREIVADHPVFGVGPNMIGVIYDQYLQPNPVHTYNPHLHNVPVQIAAERGLPALAVWLAFVITALVGLGRQLRTGPARSLAGAGVGAIVAMLAAGLFEYNFGDSEFLMLFLGLITLPYAARLTDADTPVADVSDRSPASQAALHD